MKQLMNAPAVDRREPSSEIYLVWFASEADVRDLQMK
jgi:hypothetical protein